MVTANPKTAGVARWNFLALWGHKAKQGDAACLDFVTKVGALLNRNGNGNGNGNSRMGMRTPCKAWTGLELMATPAFNQVYCPPSGSWLSLLVQVSWRAYWRPLCWGPHLDLRKVDDVRVDKQ